MYQVVCELGDVFDFTAITISAFVHLKTCCGFLVASLLITPKRISIIYLDDNKNRSGRTNLPLPNDMEEIK